MKHRARFSALEGAITVAVATGALFGAGCTTTIGEQGGPNPAASGTAGVGASSGTSGASGASGAGGNTGGTGGNVGGTGNSTGVPCQGTHVTTMKRLVRLTENQLVNTYATLFG